jgi:hypothetical protein
VSTQIDTLSSPGTIEHLGNGASLRMGERGIVWLDIEGHPSGPVLGRYDRVEVAERHLGDWRGPRGGAYIAAVKARDVRAQRLTARRIGA